MQRTKFTITTFFDSFLNCMNCTSHSGFFLLCRAQCQRNPALLSSIVKPIRGTINEQLIEDSAHTKSGPIMKDPEAVDEGVEKPLYIQPESSLPSDEPYMYT